MGYYVSDRHDEGEHDECSPYACMIAGAKAGNPLPPEHDEGHHGLCPARRCIAAQEMIEGMNADFAWAEVMPD